MTRPQLDTLPGYRRRFIVTAGKGWVRSDLEDDMHCMSVVIHHKDGVATEIEPIMHRWPWTTCPGAIEVAKKTFEGIALKDFATRGEKKTNCTHLHDLAVLAASHVDDELPLIYDILVSDPIDGRLRAEIRRNGSKLLEWEMEGWTFVAPEDLKGRTLDKLGPWINRLPASLREAAKLLRWGTMVSHGRSMPIEDQSDATVLPPNCYTFQPDMARKAVRIGEIKDFSAGAIPLKDLVERLE